MQCIALTAGTGECSDRLSKGSRFCTKHQGQYRFGIIDSYGNKLRDLKTKRYPECIAKSESDPCSNTKRGRFCTKHYMQHRHGIIDDKGFKLRDPKKKAYPECIAKSESDSCSTRIGNARFCTKHHAQFINGLIDSNGNVLRSKTSKTYSHCLLDNGTCSQYYGGRFCTKHNGQYKAGIIDKNGNNLRPLIPNKKYNSCVAAKTSPCSQYYGGRFCDKHRGQFRLGIIDYAGLSLREPLTDPDFKCQAIGCEEHGGWLGYCPYHYRRIIIGNHPELLHYPVTSASMVVKSSNSCSEILKRSVDRSSPR